MCETYFKKQLYLINATKLNEHPIQYKLLLFVLQWHRHIWCFKKSNFASTQTHSAHCVCDIFCNLLGT